MSVGKAIAAGAVVATASVALLFTGGKTDFDERVDPPFAPAEAPHPYCHEGWEAKVVKTIDTVSYNCIRGTWTVIVDTETGRFLLAEEGGDFYDEDQVPGW